ncbi:MAG: hypothetical protein DWQ02_07650 [Bacteroidetes bacterium]|nr:MAG: hypothetical protein DWQ02_07650 [Bacteroidota bacterium]
MSNNLSQTQSQVYVFNTTSMDLFVYINNYPVVLLRGFNTNEDVKYTPYGQVVPHVKESDTGGFTDGINNLHIKANDGGVTYFNPFTLPAAAVTDNLILYITFNELVIMNTDGFVLHVINKKAQ